ncbi:hypothetical protein M408DRAFT_12475 [Serendipita vermifera MAFF 305830]|uniref:Transmembrane protein n=1 Tax=Serendipita vermifera MAFF 305830 TaxID=933852 RepID=A0A0C3AAJ7_SERVB|nr:hypothetical protein M408DRAFT_12475 [Serendipita vermifera MAFF 305830]
MNTTIDDPDLSVIYSSTPSWRTDLWLEQSPPAYLSTTHRTQNGGAYATFTFTGTAVYVYGHKAADHGFRDFSVDSATPTRCDGRTGSQGSQVILYWQDGLSPGTHFLTIQHTGVFPQWLNVDFFVVTSVDPATTSQTSRTPPNGNGPTSSEDQNGAIGSPTPSSSSQSSSSNGTQSNTNVIIISVVVTAAAIALIILIWYLCARRRRKANQTAAEHKDASAAAAWGSAPTPYMGVNPNPNPHVVKPFYPYTAGAYQPDPNVAPMANVRHWEPHNEAAYYPQESDSRFNPSASTYSAPLNQTLFESVPVAIPVANPTSNMHATGPSYNSYPRPWTATNSAYTAYTDSDSNQTRIETTGQEKARFSGPPNEPKSRHTSPTFGASSSSRPLSPATVNEPLHPPPSYQT